MTQPHPKSGPRARLQELVGALEPWHVLNEADPVITGLSNDSRATEPGHLFVAIEGEKADGHDFIPQAVEAGAAAVVCSRPPLPLPHCPVIIVRDTRWALSALADAFYGSPSRELRLTGITGTDGKTSTTEILRCILNEAGFAAGSIGTLGYCIGGRWLDAELTTPDPVSLHRSLRRMLEIGLTDACMEVSSHSLIQQRVAHLRFDAAVLTNITRDHLDTHKTRENYIAAKRMLFESLASDAVAVLPADTEFASSFRKVTRAETLTYGLENLADVRGSILSHGTAGMELLVRTPYDRYTVHTTLVGAYNAQNILAAATVAFAFGIGGEVVKEAMRGFRGVPGRLERIRIPGRTDLPAVYVDYAHTPDALRKVLTALRPMTGDMLICVIGCGGDRDRTKRPLMGKAATELADLVVFTADNSRSERTEDIIEEMLAGVRSPADRYRVEPDRARAMQLAIELAATPDCVVAICGRGCERYQEIGGRSIPFDDRLVARQIMQQIPLRRRKSA